jgi:pyridoxamine 5'-phosphate oxidase
MQPAYYENFEEIKNKIWSMLDDAVTNRNSSFRIPVFICGDQSDFDGRIVVLRKSDQTNKLIQFHSDIRSFLIQSTAKPNSNLSSIIVLYLFSICHD